MEYSIKYKNELEEYVEENETDKEEYIKEFYSKEGELIKTELIENKKIIVVTYLKFDDVDEVLKNHLDEYGEVGADFMEDTEANEEGYSVNGYLYKDGKLNYARKIFYDSEQDVIKEVVLNHMKNFEPSMIEYYQYDDDKELIGIVQKNMEGKIIFSVEF